MNNAFGVYRRMGALSVILASSTILLGGCGHMAQNAQIGGPGGVRALVTNADRRLVFQRNFNNKDEVVCSEPSPDIARAFASMKQLSANGSSGSASGSASVNLQSTQAITALGGRTTTVVALRDILYNVCQDYANHMISKEAAAVALSQYGDLLVALLLSEDASGAYEIAKPFNGAAPPTLSGGTPAQQSAGSTTTTTTTTPAPTPPPAPAQTPSPGQAAGSTQTPAAQAATVVKSSPDPKLIMADFVASQVTTPSSFGPADITLADAPAAEPPAPPAGSGSGGTPSPQPTDGDKTGGQQPDPSQGTLPAGAGGPAAVAQIAKNYFVDSAIMRGDHAVFMACLSWDQDRYEISDPQRDDPFFRNLCHDYASTHGQLWLAAVALKNAQADLARAQADSAEAAAKLAMAQAAALNKPTTPSAPTKPKKSQGPKHTTTKKSA